MNVTPVESSTLASVGYDCDRALLQLEFSSHAIYWYFDVPAAVHEALLTAASKGICFNTTIRGRYRFVRVQERQPVDTAAAPAAGNRPRGAAWPGR